MNKAIRTLIPLAALTMALSASPAMAQSWILPGDANFDCKVDSEDSNIVIKNYGKTGRFIPGDVNWDGKVNALDYNTVLRNYGKTCEDIIQETIKNRLQEKLPNVPLK